MYIKLNDLLQKNDAILLTSPHNMRYFSGFSGGEGGVFVTSEKRIVFTDSRYTEQAEAEAVEFEIIETNSWQKEVCKAALASGVKKLVIEDESLSIAEFKALEKELGKIKTVFGSAELKKLRMVKTEREISKIQKAADIASDAFEYVLGVIKPGLTERELAAEIEYFMKKNGGEGTSFDTIAVSGEKTSLPHGVPTDKPIEYGDFVTMDFGCKVGGYCSDMTRTIVVGKATEEQKKIYNTVKSAQQAGLDFLHSGVLGSEADEVARKVIENAGYGEYFRHSLGHGVGLLIHELPNLSPKSELVLEENMIVTCEPGIYIPGLGGVRIEDMVCIKSDGIENLTRIPKDLIQI